ncbi:MAG: LPS assembly protein LptD [Gammaproteobacteria bacterium]|nr:LPS assembly protein LptD [Gammaproteobacteria bacterium]
MRSRPATFLLLSAALFVARPAPAQTADVCPSEFDGSASIVTADEVPESASGAKLGEDTIVISADRADVSKDDISVMSGNVQIKRSDVVLETDEARYDPESDNLSAVGNVRFRQPGIEVSGQRARFEGESERGAISLTSFRLTDSGGRGSADRIAIEGQNRVVMNGVRYTTCAGDKPAWTLVAPKLVLDNEKGTGSGRNVRVDFKGFPLIYAPYISFPISDKRKSGVLTPDFGHANRSGTAVQLPFYWNIAPNYDATITPRLLLSRGLQLNTEFRYLLPRTSGKLYVEYLNNDDETRDDRKYVSYQNQSSWARRWSMQADLNHVSDNTYFEDLGSSSSEASLTHLERRVDFRYDADSWRVLNRWQFLQTIFDSIGPEDRPYRRLPQLLLNGDWNPGGGRFGLGLDAELVNFDRSTGVTGVRLDLQPEVSLKILGNGYYFIPRAAYRLTHYDLNDTAPGEDDGPSRSAPVLTLDTGLVFERDSAVGKDIVQTLEPRFFYSYIPYRDQSMLPVFDTDLADFNLVQLFQANRFIGADRLGDANQVSIGVTSRYLNTNTGRQYLSATLGQTAFFDDRQVALPGQIAPTSKSSDLIAEVSASFSELWRADMSLQWDPSDSTATKSAARLFYTPGQRRILSLGYRFRRGLLEQSDIAMAWPLGDRWRFVGRWNYSMRESQTLDRLIGLEYERCCWGLRVASRRFITTRTGESDTTLLLQLELKGLSSVGRRTDSFLDRGILGYSQNR